MLATLALTLLVPLSSFAADFGSDPDFSWQISILKGTSRQLYSNFDKSAHSITEITQVTPKNEKNRATCQFIPTVEESILLKSKIKTEKLRIVCNVAGTEIEGEPILCKKALDGKVQFEKKQSASLRIGEYNTEAIHIDALCVSK